MGGASSEWLRRTVTRALTDGDPSQLPLWFRIEVLRRYKEQGASLTRTDHMGRVVQLGRLSVDFGLLPEAGLIHLPFADFLRKVPGSEREHWIAHLAHLPVAEPFLKARLRPACVDDGELRELDLPQGAGG